MLDSKPKIFKMHAFFDAGIAQLVERNLAKVEVASSRLVSRSNIQKGKASCFPFLTYTSTDDVSAEVMAR